VPSKASTAFSMRSPGHLTPDSLNPLSRKSRASSGLSLLVLTSRKALPKSGARGSSRPRKS